MCILINCWSPNIHKHSFLYIPLFVNFGYYQIDQIVEQENVEEQENPIIRELE